ncbi:MAG: FHA domain-containing protein [Myxococcales bacterium]|nr:FHA domain-containing protein [Myxococcales bacterium]
MPTLTVNGPNLMKRVELPESGTLLIGRCDESDLVLPSEHISRRHAELMVAGQELRISDLGSRNGTRLNGQLVGTVSRRLSPGDVAVIGPYTLRVEVDRAQAPGCTIPDGFVTLLASTPKGRPAAATDSEEEDTRERQLVRSLGALAQAALEGASALDLLHQALRLAVEATGFNEAAVLLRGVGGALEPFCLPEFRGAHPLIWSSTIVGEVLHRRTTLLVHHLPSAPRYHTDSVILSGSVHVLCAPLVRGERVFGAIYLATRGAELPSQATVDLVGEVAAVAAAALEARGKRQMPERAVDLARFLGEVIEEVRRLREQSPSAIPAPELDVVLNEAARAAGELRACAERDEGDEGEAQQAA